jgi:hypothetical protein
VGSESRVPSRTNPRYKLTRYRVAGVGVGKTIAVRTRKVIRVVLNPAVRVSVIVPRTIHVVGVGCWIVTNRNVTHVVVLGQVAAVIASTILGGVVRHGWRKGGSRSGDTTRTDNPVVQRVITMTMSDVMLAHKVGARMRMLLVGRFVFDISGVEGKV